MGQYEKDDFIKKLKLLAKIQDLEDKHFRKLLNPYSKFKLYQNHKTYHLNSLITEINTDLFESNEKKIMTIDRRVKLSN